MYLLPTPVQTFNIRSDQGDQNSSFLMQMEVKKEKWCQTMTYYRTNGLIPEIMPQAKSLV